MYNSIIPSIRARFLRIHPWDYKSRISMRVELFGCALGNFDVFCLFVFVFFCSQCIPITSEIDGRRRRICFHDH